MPRVVTGLEVLLETPELIAGRRWALLANHSAVTADLDPARVALAAAGVGEPARLFAPEHGLDGVAQDMVAVGDLRDPVTGVEVKSLYGAVVETLAPSPQDLADIDVLVVDLPDIGTRYYTFAATMDLAMEACEREGVELLVLDRPNPMTLGEIALLLHRDRYPGLELTVVPCRGWRRCDWWDETGLPWVPPSPNMPTLDTATLYPGLCLVEATTLSEGRGTTRPFHLVGAPWIDAERLVAALRERDPAGVAFRVARFTPQFHKHADAVCSGVELYITDRRILEPVALGLHILKTIHDLHPESFGWRSDPYEFVSDVPALDLLTGSGAARSCLEHGDPLEPLLEEWRIAVKDFDETLGGILLYHETL